MDTASNDGLAPLPDATGLPKKKILPTVGPIGWASNFKKKKKSTRVSLPELPPSSAADHPPSTPSQEPPKKKKQKITNQTSLKNPSDHVLANDPKVIPTPTTAPQTSASQTQNTSSNLQKPESQPPPSSLGESATVNPGPQASSDTHQKPVWPSLDSFSNLTPQEILARFAPKATSTPSTKKKKKSETVPERPVVPPNQSSSASVKTSNPKDLQAGQQSNPTTEDPRIIKPIPLSHPKKSLKKLKTQEHQSTEQHAISPNPGPSGDQTQKNNPPEQHSTAPEIIPQPQKTNGLDKKTTKTANAKKKASLPANAGPDQPLSVQKTNPSSNIIVDKDNPATNVANNQTVPISGETRETIPIPKSKSKKPSTKPKQHDDQDQQRQQDLVPPQSEGISNRPIPENDPEKLSQVDSPAPRPGKRRRIDKPAAQPPADGLTLTDNPSQKVSEPGRDENLEAANSNHAKELQPSPACPLHINEKSSAQPIESNPIQPANTQSSVPALPASNQSQSQPLSHVEKEATKAPEAKRKHRKSTKQPAGQPDHNVAISEAALIASPSLSKSSKAGKIEIPRPNDQPGKASASSSIPLTAPNLLQATNSQTQATSTSKKSQTHQPALPQSTATVTDQNRSTILQSDDQNRIGAADQHSHNIPESVCSNGTKRERIKTKAKQKKLQKKQSLRSGSVSTTQEVKRFSSASPHPTQRDSHVPSRQSTPISMINVPKHFGRWELSIPSDRDVSMSLLARMHQFLDEAVCAGFAKPIFRDPTPAITEPSPSSTRPAPKELAPDAHATKLPDKPPSTIQDPIPVTDESGFVAPGAKMLYPSGTTNLADIAPRIIPDGRGKRTFSICSSSLSEDINDTVMMTLGLEENSQSEFAAGSINPKAPKDLAVDSIENTTDAPPDRLEKSALPAPISDTSSEADLGSPHLSKSELHSNNKGATKQAENVIAKSDIHQITPSSDEPATSSNDSCSPPKLTQNPLPGSAIEVHGRSPTSSAPSTQPKISVLTQKPVSDSDSSSEDESEVSDDYCPPDQADKAPPIQSIPEPQSKSNDFTEAKQRLPPNGPNGHSTSSITAHSLTPNNGLDKTSPAHQIVATSSDSSEDASTEGDSEPATKDITVNQTDKTPMQKIVSAIPNPSLPQQNIITETPCESDSSSEDESDSSPEDSAPPSAQRPPKLASEESSSSDSEDSSTSCSDATSPKNPPPPQPSSVPPNRDGRAGLYAKGLVAGRRKTLDAFRPLDFTSKTRQSIGHPPLSTDLTKQADHSDKDSSSSSDEDDSESDSSGTDDDPSTTKKKKADNPTLGLPAHKLAGSAASSKPTKAPSSTANPTPTSTSPKKKSAKGRRSIAQLWAIEEAKISKSKKKS
ncbi:hypothetical protein PGT21_003178 [Puccinia graminis f. sp. tritici]|uniref:Uncharacterized protein n=1 Tax=Puccinia graminis f. sp. tritici TaxID=56615 RepID=A0A5B0NX83_PUCGR|nr:hypothetical protein PGT21_003178 [Puccinia graminis f. sp. tritici]KAA1105143.1 hypothetical protein PGTUg99_017382 [Puccinia graminis f. sp. tritici]